MIIPQPRTVRPNNSPIKVLPPGWQWATLRDVGEIKGGVTKGQKRRSDERLTLVPYLRVANVQRGFLDLNEVKLIEATEQEIRDLSLQQGDILLNEGGDRDKLGRGWIWQEQLPTCIHQNHVFRVRLFCGEVEPKFVSWYANSQGQAYFFDEGKQTTNLASINLTKLSNLPLPLAPANEQQRVIAELEKQLTRLDAAVAALTRAQANLKRYRAAVLKAACEGRLVPSEAKLALEEGRSYETGEQFLARILKERRVKWETDQLSKMQASDKPPKNNDWKENYNVPHSAGTNLLPPVPAGWSWLTIETIAFVTKLAGFEYTKFVKYDPNGDLPVIKAENISKHGFRSTDFSFVRSEAVKHLTRSRARKDDILMVFIGANLGVVARVPLDKEYFLGPNVALIRVISGFVFSSYLESYLRSGLGFGMTKERSKATAQGSISMSEIRQIPVALPPAAEQIRIADELDRRFSNLRQLDREVASALLHANALRHSILKRAFEGKLVPQDPNDESASTLLERIRAMRPPLAKRTPKPKKTKAAAVEVP